MLDLEACEKIWPTAPSVSPHKLRDIPLELRTATPEDLTAKHLKYIEWAKPFLTMNKLPPLEATKNGVQGDREWAVDH